jgi:hypothetical protein
MAAPTYRVNAYRDGCWWILHVPQLDGARGLDGCRGQACRYEHIEKDARDVIALVVDVVPSTIVLDLNIGDAPVPPAAGPHN